MRWIPALVLVMAPAAVLASGQSTTRPARNPALVNLQPNVWFKLHEQQPGDAVRFKRQEHGGSCFDSRRNRLILFGSNSHGRDWHNSPRMFDPASAAWSQLYPDDDFKTYAADEKGYPVAGEKGDHPWTMHTFGALVYDESRDEMVVPIYDAHLVPGRFTNITKDIWPRIKVHPTWTFDCARGLWRPLDCRPEHFFPHCAAYDSDRKAVLGYRPDGIWELAGEPRQWRRLTQKAFLGGYHNNASYDRKNKALAVFGTNTNSNDIEAFWPATAEHRLMPTPGVRPPKDQHNPMAFEPDLGQVVVVVDRLLEPELKEKSKAQAETWLYDLAKDAWTQVETATLPFAVGMNYNMEYDPLHRCLLLVTGGYSGPTTVWALRLAPGRSTQDTKPPTSAN